MNYTETEQLRKACLKYLELMYWEILGDNADSGILDNRDKQSALAVAQAKVVCEGKNGRFPNEDDVLADWAVEKGSLAIERAESRAVDNYIDE